MSLLAALLAVSAILLWPDSFTAHRLATLPGGWPGPVVTQRVLDSARKGTARFRPGRSAAGVSAVELLGLLDALAPALEAGIAPASALRLAADARSGSERLDPVASLAHDMASASAEGATLGPLWHQAARSAGSAELMLLAQAWSLTEDLGVPLAQAVRTTAGLLQARIAHEQRLAGAVAGAKATVNVLTVLPVGGPLLALVLGVGPLELYAGSSLTQASLALGLLLAGIGRWWVHRMVRAVARGPVIS